MRFGKIPYILSLFYRENCSNKAHEVYKQTIIQNTFITF